MNTKDSYDPSAATAVQLWMEEARRTSAAMDVLDRKSGFDSPIDCGPIVAIRTAIEAILCGLTLISKDIDMMSSQFVDGSVAPICQGVILLQQVENEFRQHDSRDA